MCVICITKLSLHYYLFQFGTIYNIVPPTIKMKGHACSITPLNETGLDGFNKGGVLEVGDVVEKC